MLSCLMRSAMTALMLVIPATAIGQSDIIVDGDRNITIRRQAVSMADLDLRHDGQIYIAENRLRKVARSLCAPGPDSFSVRERPSDARDCFDDAYSLALYDLDELVSDIRARAWSYGNGRRGHAAWDGRY